MAGKRGPRKAASSSGSLSRSATYDDIPKDDEDLFEAGRDQILLDSNSRQIDSEDDMDVGLDDQEVLGVTSDRSDDSDAGPEEDLEDEEGDEYAHLPKASKKAGITVSSDEDLSESDDEEEDVHENDRGWGSNKRAYYNSNDLDAIDSDSEIDEEQARELELKEVKRLQKKSRSAMDDSDFGLGDDEVEGGVGKAAKDAGREERRRQLDELDQPLSSTGPARTSAMTASTMPPSSSQGLLAKLQKESPETVALAGEFADMIEEFSDVDAELKKMMAKKVQPASIELLHLHHQTLVTYITTMTFYFHLRATPEYAADPTKLREHPVLLRMMRLKQGLSAMEEMGLTLDRPSVSDLEGFAADSTDELNMSQGSEDDDLGDLDSDELAELTADAEEKENTAPIAKAIKAAIPKNKKKANGKVLQSHKDDDEDMSADSDLHDSGEPALAKVSKKAVGAKKAKNGKARPQVATPLAAGFADLDDEPTPEIKLRKAKNGTSARSNPFAASSASTNLDDATFGELSELSAIDSAERAARKKSLQFHASAIENKALQRSKAAKERQSGDADIPYRDRERSRAAVEATKASQQANQQLQLRGGAQNTRLDGDDGWGESDEKDWREVMGQSNGLSRGSGEAIDDDDADAADYYDLVASSRKRGRAEAKAEYDQERDAERFALMEDATLEDGQHRGITRQIEKNKGLTPHRPKTSRNPRVKKRLKYEQAKKKLGSRQAVFKGGQASLQGGYGGEASGISTHLVKSRKLG